MGVLVGGCILVYGCIGGLYGSHLGEEFSL